MNNLNKRRFSFYLNHQGPFIRRPHSEGEGLSS